MNCRFWKLSIGCAILVAGLASSTPAAAANYSVTYNPYGTVNWGTTLRCQSQHHDHASFGQRIQALDAAGYCAVTFMSYSGAFRPSTLAEWNAMGNPNPDPGQPTGWGPPRRWPPVDYGAPPVPMTNLKFYLPGAEEAGLYEIGITGGHIQSTFMTTYIEGSGCLSCGIGGIRVATNLSGLPPSQVHYNTHDLIDRILANGGHATLNHPAGPPDKWAAYDGFGSMEMFNNLWRNFDDLAGNDNASDQMMAAWDYMLEHKSPRIWGVSGNDWYSAWTALGQTYTPASSYPPVTLRNRDRGKLQVLLTAYDVDAYRTAFEAGAFFAVVEDNEVKSAYPTVTQIGVTWNRISIWTAAGNETIRWVGNGEVLHYGPWLDLRGLPEDLVYVRAEIEDGQGRTVYTQPFSLGNPIPPPPEGPAIPALPVSAAALLEVALIVAVNRMAPRSAARG